MNNYNLKGDIEINDNKTDTDCKINNNNLITNNTYVFEEIYKNISQSINPLNLDMFNNIDINNEELESNLVDDFNSLIENDNLELNQLDNQIKKPQTSKSSKIKNEKKRKISSNNWNDNNKNKIKRRKGRICLTPEEKKRKTIQSARDCRIRKKKYINSLENKLKEFMEQDNSNKVLIKKLSEKIKELEVRVNLLKNPNLILMG